jgi:hypothetical protein
MFCGRKEDGTGLLLELDKGENGRQHIHRTQHAIQKSLELASPDEDSSNVDCWLTSFVFLYLVILYHLLQWYSLFGLVISRCGYSHRSTVKDGETAAGSNLLQTPVEVVADYCVCLLCCLSNGWQVPMVVLPHPGSLLLKKKIVPGLVVCCCCCCRWIVYWWCAGGWCWIVPGLLMVSCCCWG